MPTECSAGLFGFVPVEGREVVAVFGGGAINLDAGSMPLGPADHAIGFHDARRQHLIEHEAVTLPGQRGLKPAASHRMASILEAYLVKTIT